MPPAIDLTGKKFDRLKVLSRAGSVGKRQEAAWNCVCICGNTKIALGYNLRKGHTKSCGCYLADWIRSTKRIRPYESLYNWLLAKCEKSHHACELTYENFLKFTRTKQCHYCGSKIYWTKFNLGINGMAYNLDRKDNSLGYTVRNCVVCCTVCNSLKSKLPYKVFVEHIRRMYERLFL